MTREDYKKYVDDTFVFLAISDTYSLIDKIFDELEQRVAELEQRVKALVDERANMQKTHRDTISTFVSEHTIMGVMLNNSTLNCYLCDDCLKDAK